MTASDPNPRYQRIAIVLITRWWRSSIDLDGMARGFRALGLVPVLYCLGNDAGEAGFEVVETSMDAMSSSRFWREQSLSGAIVFNWLQHPALIRALKEAGVKTGCRVDTDGEASARVFPKSHFHNNVSHVRPWRSYASALKRFCLRYLRDYKKNDRLLIDCIREADVTIIESDQARENLVRIAAYHQQPQLAEKIKVVPHSVDDIFLLDTSPVQKQKALFGGGRWNDPQKNGPLMRAALEEVLRQDPEFTIYLAGHGADEVFGALATKYRQVRILGFVSKEELRDVLDKCRFILASSRWESYPIGTLEMLCRGGTFVAPDLPGFVDMAQGTTFGRAVRHANPKALALAVLEENASWEAGLRDPVRISQYWKAKVSNLEVASGIVQALALESAEAVL